MFNGEPTGVLPVVEDLGSIDVSPHAPNGGVRLAQEILVAQKLRVEILHLERAVVDLVRDGEAGGRTGKEQGVVIAVVLALVEMHKCQGVHFVAVHIFPLDVRRHKVEEARVKLDVFIEHGRDEAVVSELVHHGWAKLEPEKMA